MFLLNLRNIFSVLLHPWARRFPQVQADLVEWAFVLSKNDLIVSEMERSNERVTLTPKRNPIGQEEVSRVRDGQRAGVRLP